MQSSYDASVLERIAKAKLRFGLSAAAAVHSCYEAGRDGWWLHRRLREHGIDKGLHPAFQEALAPQGHLAPIKIDLGGDVLVLPALSGQQHDPGALLHTSPMCFAFTPRRPRTPTTWYGRPASGCTPAGS